MNLTTNCANLMAHINNCYKELKQESKECQIADNDLKYAYHAGQCKVLSEELVTLINLMHEMYGFNTLFERDMCAILSDSILLIKLN